MFEHFVENLVSTIVAVGSLFFPFIQGVEPAFSDVRIEVSSGKMYLSTQVINCYTEELDKVLASGQEIRLNFRIEVFPEKSSKAVLRKTFYHSVKHNLLDANFDVFFSEEDVHRQFNDITSVHAGFTNVDRVKIVEADNLLPGKRYFIRISAELDDITFLGTQDDLDLMLFRNNTEPTIRTELFDLSRFAY